MKLSKSDPSTYDNSSTLASNLLKNKQRPLYNKMISRGIIYQLLAPFFKTAHLKSTVTDDRVKRAITYIRNHISDELCIDKVAETLRKNKNYFIRIFKKEKKGNRNDACQFHYPTQNRKGSVIAYHERPAGETNILFGRFRGLLLLQPGFQEDYRYDT